jgi:hypothetical protein
MTTYLRTPGLDGNCHDCNPDDPCAGSNYIYLPCGNQCGVPEETIVLPYDTTEYAYVKVNGVVGVYYRDQETSDPVNATVEAGDPPTSCPTTWNHCFIACCPGADIKAIIISDADFVTLFPSDPNNRLLPTAALCIVWENCYFCSHSYVLNPVSTGLSEITAGTYTACQTWFGNHEVSHHCDHCCDCGNCIPRLPGILTVTISGSSDSRLNTSHVLSCNNGDCAWAFSTEGGGVWGIQLTWVDGVWTIYCWGLVLDPNYNWIPVTLESFALTAGPCAPEGSYSNQTEGSSATCILS